MGRVTERRRVVRVRGGRTSERPDTLVAEEPLEIRLGGRQLAITMRTPGDDFSLAAGFLVSEGVLAHAEELAGIAYCLGADEEGRNTYNVVDVRLAPGVPMPDFALERNVYTTSSCGLCGKTSLEAVRTTTRWPLPDGPGATTPGTHGTYGTPGTSETPGMSAAPSGTPQAPGTPEAVPGVATAGGRCCTETANPAESAESTRGSERVGPATSTVPVGTLGPVEPDVLAGMPDTLRAAQRVFEKTGGLHAAGLFSPEGELLDVREDVGRHNAVDKLIGRALQQGRLPLHDCVLMVSGRASFELAQKAVMAGIPMLAAVSAPSSLAVDLAEETGLTLVGFLRGSSMNVYAGAQRVALPDGASERS